MIQDKETPSLEWGVKALDRPSDYLMCKVYSIWADFKKLPGPHSGHKEAYFEVMIRLCIKPTVVPKSGFFLREVKGKIH